MALKFSHACILSAGAVVAALILSADRGASAQVAAPVIAPWQITVIERSTLQTSDRVVRDAMLLEHGTGRTWILTKAEGLDPVWVPVAKKP